MKKIRIWHSIKHDDYTVTEKPFDEKRGLLAMCREIAEDHGFWTGDGFVPWHRVNYVELTEE